MEVVTDIDSKETEKSLDAKKEDDINLASKNGANLQTQKSIENLESKKGDGAENIETIKDLEPIIKSEIVDKDISDEPEETENDKLQESESQNGKNEEEETTSDSQQHLENEEIIETIPSQKIIKAESQLQATPTISIEHVDDTPENNTPIQTESIGKSK